MLEEVLARYLHQGQVRRGWEPYIRHPERIAGRATGNTLKAAAWLHDVVEDCGVTLAELESAGVSEGVLVLVELLTKRDGESSKDAVQRLIKSGNKDAIALKILDLEDNQWVREKDYWPGMEEAVVRYGETIRTLKEHL